MTDYQDPESTGPDSAEFNPEESGNEGVGGSPAFLTQVEFDEIEHVLLAELGRTLLAQALIEVEQRAGPPANSHAPLAQGD